MKRYILRVAIVLSVAMLAAGCRGGRKEPTTMPTTMPTTETTTAPTTQATTQPTTQATLPDTLPGEGTDLPGGTGNGTDGSESVGQDNARRIMPRGY